ncbi:MAG: hypothetical protein LBE91_10145 [Tannerella sp.]|jgi:hypothetical protein|nr:hypothetical protein [Tannerella sp.]
MILKYRIIIVLSLLIFALPMEGQKPEIKIFTTGYHGAIPIYYIILKDYGKHKTFYYSDLGDVGRWEEKGDSVFLFAEYKNANGNIFPLDTVSDSPFWKKNTRYVFRNDSLIDYTAYDKVESFDIIDGDTIIYPFMEEKLSDLFFFHELKYEESPQEYKVKDWNSIINIAYSEQDSGVLLFMFFSPGYFECYYPETDGSLLGRVEKKRQTIILYPLYIQRFGLDGKMIFEKVRNTKKIKFRSKGYVLKRIGRTQYPFSKTYNRYVRKK